VFKQNKHTQNKRAHTCTNTLTHKHIYRKNNNNERTNKT